MKSIIDNKVPIYWIECYLCEKLISNQKTLIYKNNLVCKSCFNNKGEVKNEKN